MSHGEEFGTPKAGLGYDVLLLTDFDGMFTTTLVVAAQLQFRKVQGIRLTSAELHGPATSLVAWTAFQETDVPAIFIPRL